jgi:hypothetical protein
MRKLFAIAITGSLFLLACNKPDFHAPAAVTTLPEAASSALATSPTTVLTAHPWMYQGFYLHYIDQQHKGDPQYIRGGSNNIINLDATRITYKTDGTFVERDGVNTFPGTWQFTNAADSVLVMNYSYGTDVYTVVTLNSTHLNYTKLIPISYRHNNLTYSELVPAQ